MKRVVLAIDLQPSFKPAEVIVNTVQRISTKLPIVSTILVQGDDPTKIYNRDWIEFDVPEHDTSLIDTRYIYTRESYGLPRIIPQMMIKNKVQEIIIVGAHTEATLLAAGFSLFDTGIKTSLVAPLCLSGQYHQHSVTMKIWENSIGPVYETVAEIGIGIS